MHFLYLCFLFISRSRKFICCEHKNSCLSNYWSGSRRVCWTCSYTPVLRRHERLNGRTRRKHNAVVHPSQWPSEAQNTQQCTLWHNLTTSFTQQFKQSIYHYIKIYKNRVRCRHIRPVFDEILRTPSVLGTVEVFEDICSNKTCRVLTCTEIWKFSMVTFHLS